MIARKIEKVLDDFYDKKEKIHHFRDGFLVDDTGLEPVTSRTSSGCSTS